MACLQDPYRSQSIEQSLTPLETPPEGECEDKIVHPWPEPETEPEDKLTAKRRKINNCRNKGIRGKEDFNVPHQEVLLLHAPRQKYAHVKEQPIPSLENDREMLVAVDVVGLNPIDWKAPCV